MASLNERHLESYLERGFVVLEGFVDHDAVAELRSQVDELLISSPGRGGVRNVLQRSSALRAFASRELSRFARRFIGEPTLPVKLTIFDKTPEANWKVPMHQDLTIAVRERREVPGFGPWSTKEGVSHVQPPAAVLESVVAIRLHLDKTARSGGALRVVPGSHRRGRLASSEMQRMRERPTVLCPVGVGGAMIMSPLLVHASSAADRPSRRRVLHFEFAAAELPGGLEWAC